MSSKTPLYDRIVKALNNGKHVVLKMKTDGTYSVCIGMKGKLVLRTPFDHTSLAAAKADAATGNVRTSKAEYLNSKPYILFAYTISASPLTKKSTSPDPLAKYSDEGEDEDIDDPYLNDDDDDDDDFDEDEVVARKGLAAESRKHPSHTNREVANVGDYRTQERPRGRLALAKKIVL